MSICFVTLRLELFKYSFWSRISGETLKREVLSFYLRFSFTVLLLSGIPTGAMTRATGTHRPIMQHRLCKPHTRMVQHKDRRLSWVMVVHAFNPSTWEAEAGESL